MTETPRGDKPDHCHKKTDDTTQTKPELGASVWSSMEHGTTKHAVADKSKSAKHSSTAGSSRSDAGHAVCDSLTSGASAIPAVAELANHLPLSDSYDYANGLHSEYRLDRGTLHEYHSGNRPEQNFQINQKPGGRAEVLEPNTNAPYKMIDDPVVNVQRERLIELANTRIGNEFMRSKFEADMSRFEDHSKIIADNYKRQGLDEIAATRLAHQEVARTYGHIARLLKASDNPDIKLDSTRRAEIAADILSHAATPTSIDQGNHNTCNVCAVEVRTYARNPSEAAKLVVDVATRGEYVTKSGVTVKIDPESLKPHDESTIYPVADGKRSLSSQIFQVAAVNIGVAPMLSYRQVEPTSSGDTGERLYSHSILGGSKLETDNPALSDDQIVTIGNEITGSKECDWFVDHKSYVQAEGLKKVLAANSQETLESVIAKAKLEGKLPIAVGVDTGNEPWLTDSGAGLAGGSGGGHVVTVFDYQPGHPAKVQLDNQWNSKHDHLGDKALTVEQLYLSLREPAKTVMDYAAAVERHFNAGRVNNYERMELLRLKAVSEHISSNDYVTGVSECIERLSRDKRLKFINPVEEREQVGKLRQLIILMPFEDRLGCMARAAEKGAVDGREADTWLVGEMSWIRELYDAKKCEQEPYMKAVRTFKTIADTLPQDRRAALWQSLSKAQHKSPEVSDAPAGLIPAKSKEHFEP